MRRFQIMLVGVAVIGAVVYFGLPHLSWRSSPAKLADFKVASQEVAASDAPTAIVGPLEAKGAENSFEVRCRPRIVQRYDGRLLMDREGNTRDGDRHYTELQLSDGRREFIYESIFPPTVFPPEIKQGILYTFVIRSEDRLILQVRDKSEKILFAYPVAADKAARTIASELATFREERILITSKPGGDSGYDDAHDDEKADERRVSPQG